MKFLRMLLALAAHAFLAGCVVESTGYESYQGYGSPSYVSPGYGSYRPAYYGGGGYYPGSYRRYDNRYDGRYDDWERDDNDRRGNSSKKSSDNDIRIVDYNQRERRESLPTGYHPPEWWKARGYSIGDNTYKTRDGEVKGKSSSSSNKKSSSSSSKKKSKKD